MQFEVKAGAWIREEPKRTQRRKNQMSQVGGRKFIYDPLSLHWSSYNSQCLAQISSLLSSFFPQNAFLSDGREKKNQKIAANPKEPFYLSQCNRKCPVPNFLSPDAKFGPYASQIPNPVTLGWHEHTEISSGNTWEGQGGIQAQLHGQPGHCLEGKLRFSKETEIKGVVVFTHGTGEHR